MRVLRNGQVLARLSAIQPEGDRITATWEGPPPPFEPSEQLEPLVLESDDGLERRDGWLLGVLKPFRGGNAVRVEIGSERNGPPWRRSGLSSAPPPAPKKSEGGVHVLVVDDDSETVELVAGLLEEQGFTVRRALSGREALEMARQHPPDVAIIDLIMPEIGGEDVCTAMRRDARFAGTRILVLSGAEDTRTVAAGCDADSAVVKPFTSELLVHEVLRLVGQ